MNNNPLISLIIPCYNHGRYIQETINSVLTQSYNNFEIIIVNDGSTDKQTLDVLNTINNPRIKVLQQPNLGPSVARNKAVEIAAGEFIVPLDADDLICANTLCDALAVFQKDHSIDIVYGNCEYFGEKDFILVQKPANAVNLLKGNTIAMCSIIRKSSLLLVGGFDEFLSKKGLEDWEFWINAFSKSCKFKYINKTFFRVRYLQSSRTFSQANQNLPEIKAYIYKKHLSFLIETFEFLYHQNKNLKASIDYRVGNILLLPFRWIKNMF